MGFVANDTVLGQTLAEARVLAKSWLLWGGLASAALITGLTGPFGTYTTMPVPTRLIYWGFVVVTTYWIGLLTSYSAATWAEMLGVPAVWSVGLGAALASLPVALWLAALHAVVLADPFGAEFLRLLPYVTAITVVMTHLFEAIASRDAGASVDAPLTPEPEWLDHLPRELGRTLNLIQSQDHYLRVETSLGETLLRGSISEAAEALGDYGVRVHRSWWVSRSAIRGYRMRNGARVLVLSSGQEVPVGRSYRRAVRAFVDRL